MSSWIDTLRAACARTSQGQVAAELQAITRTTYPSGAVISQVLSGKYPGRTDHLRDLVEGYFEGASVDCPVTGSLTRDLCRTYQELPYSQASALRVRLFRTCPICRHRNQEGAS